MQEASQPTSIFLAIAFLAFGGLVVLMEVTVLYRKNQGFGPQAVRMVGVTIIVTIAAALTVSGVPTERLPALIGFLGTLAGYFAGRTEAKSEQ